MCHVSWADAIAVSGAAASWLRRRWDAGGGVLAADVDGALPCPTTGLMVFACVCYFRWFVAEKHPHQMQI